MAVKKDYFLNEKKNHVSHRLFNARANASKKEQLQSKI